MLCDWLLSATFQGLFLCRNVLLFNFFLWLNNIPSYGHTYLFICSSVDGHLGCFHFFWLLWLMLLWTFMYNEPRHCTFRGQGPNLALDYLLVQTGDSWEVPCLWPLGKLYAVKFSQGGPDVYLSHGSQISLAVHMTFVAFSVLQNNMQLTLFLLS